MFDQLLEWRNKSNRQFSDILDFHRIGISKGMNILVKEIFDLRAELSVIREEKGVLLQTVDNLKTEMRQMNEKTLSFENSHKHEERLKTSSIEMEDGADEDVSQKMGPDLETDKQTSQAQIGVKEGNLVNDELDPSKNENVNLDVNFTELDKTTSAKGSLAGETRSRSDDTS